MKDDYLTSLYQDLSKYDRTRKESDVDREKYLDTMRKIKYTLRYVKVTK